MAGIFFPCRGLDFDNKIKDCKRKVDVNCIKINNFLFIANINTFDWHFIPIKTHLTTFFLIIKALYISIVFGLITLIHYFAHFFVDRFGF